MKLNSKSVVYTMLHYDKNSMHNRVKLQMNLWLI